VGDHFRGVVDPDHVGVGPALQQVDRGSSGSTPQVDDLPRIRVTDTGEEFGEGTFAFAFVPEILLWIPAS
jgi:hypothetical protein